MAARINAVVGTIACVAAHLQSLGAVHAAEAIREYDLKIERQPLARALQAFAKQAGVQIIFFSAVTEGRDAPPLIGRFTTVAALEQLLDDSRLTFRQINPNTIEICVRASVIPGQPEAPQCAPTIPESPMNHKTTTQLANVGRSQSRSRRARTISGALMSAAAMTAGAQTDAPGLEEVVVTAQKRVERLQDVPLAVTAVSGEALLARGVNDTAGLVNVTPSLTYTQGANPNNTNFRVRGIGTALFGQGFEPSVSVVMDGVVLARSAQGFSDLADIERVEVLRGPQGTLFGKNAVGGLINVVTKRPSDAFEADADLTVAEEEEYRLRGSVSGPINDTTGYRVTGYYNDVGGHIRNVTLNQDVNGSESWGLRGKYEWDATDRLNLLFTADHREAETLCCSSQYVSIVDNPLLEQVLLPVVAGFNNRKETENQNTYFDTEQTTFSVEANLDLDAVTLTSLTAYQDFWVINEQPIDRLNTPTPLWFPVTNGWFDINGGTVDLQQFSQELRITSPGLESFNYVAGLYYLDMNLERTFKRRSGNCAPGGTPAAFGQPCIVPQYRSQGGFKSEAGNKNAAVFGQIDFALVGNLVGLLGARYQWEEISYAGVRTDERLAPGDLPLVGFAPSSGSGKSDDTVLTGKAGLQYKFSDDAQTYLSWSTGYKGRGYETEFTARFENQIPVEPEEAKAWELGFKAQLFDGALSLNTALFHAEYDNLQVQANRGNPDTGLVQFVTTNAGNSTTQGAEVEFTWLPISDFTLSGGVTYLDSSVDVDGLNCPLSDRAAAPVIAGNAPSNTCYRPAPGGAPIQDVEDGRLPNAPEWRGTLTARYDFPVGATGWESFVQLSGSSQSKFNFVIEQDPLTEHDGYTIVDASVGFRAPNNRYRITLFAKNLFDEHYLTLMARSATLTTATYSPNSLTGNVPKDANRYFGATFGVSF
jgi:iron complex outermembrane receptor protein